MLKGFKNSSTEWNEDNTPVTEIDNEFVDVIYKSI
jgi:hypothetical protein